MDKKGQFVCLSTGSLNKFCHRFQYIFYVLTIEKHVQHVQFYLLIQLMEYPTPRKTNESNAWPILLCRHYTHWFFCFSWGQITINCKKEQSCTSFKPILQKFNRWISTKMHVRTQNCSYFGPPTTGTCHQFSIIKRCIEVVCIQKSCFSGELWCNFWIIPYTS